MATSDTLKSNHFGLALMYILLACLSYTAMCIFVKETLPSTPIQITVFFRFLIMFLFLLPLVLRYRGTVLHPKRPWLLVARGVIGFLGITLTFMALHRIPMATAVLLSSTEPLFIPFVFLLSSGIKIIPKLYIGILVGLAGVALVLHPQHGFFQFGAFIALAAGVCRALTISLLRVSTKSDSSMTIMFYFFLIGTIVAWLVSLPYWHHPGQWAWGWLVAIGFSSLIFQYGVTKTFSHAPARIMAPFNYLAVVFAAIADWFLWGQGMTWYVGVGITLVVFGAVLTAFLGRELL